MVTRAEVRAVQAVRAAARLEPFVRLNAEVDRAVDAGLRVPCIGRGEWTSEDPGVRAVAARECAGCPILGQCAQTAQATRQRFGVWAGHDVNPAAGTRTP